MRKYVLGFDYGTASCRMICADYETGTIVFSKIINYKSGTMDEYLPASGEKLPEAWALQDPDDYTNVQRDLVRALLDGTDIKPEEIISIGVDFTNCTMMPIDSDGNVLCQLPEYRNRPNAWVKLWKHHAAEKYAKLLNKLADSRKEKWFERYGNTVSAEWLFPKILQIFFEDRDIYDATETFIEADDWMTLKMTGNMVRSSATLGVNAFFSPEDGYPSDEFFNAIDPEFGASIRAKLGGEIGTVGECAGTLTKEYAEFLGLTENVTVSVGHGDSEVAACGLGVMTPDRMIMAMGTSLCYQYMSDDYKSFKGLCAIVKDGMVPGHYAYEAGQCAVGDIYDWFVDNCVPEIYYKEAADKGVHIHKLMDQKAEAIKIGSTGIVALDWFNGVRSNLMNYDLTGLIVGMTIRTKAEEIYKALVESTAFGARQVIEAFKNSGLVINELIATGGLALKSGYVMQTFADVLNMNVNVYAGSDAGVMGSAVCAAVAYDNHQTGKLDFVETAERMVHQEIKTYTPIPENVKVFDELFDVFKQLSAQMGEDDNSPMMKLIRMKQNIR